MSAKLKANAPSDVDADDADADADGGGQQSAAQHVRREDASQTVDAAERNAVALTAKQTHPLRAGMDAALAASDAAFLTRPVLAIIAEYALAGLSGVRMFLSPNLSRAAPLLRVVFGCDT